MHSSHVFTYGSLMFPQVWRRVVRGDYRSAPARLDGYARFAIAGETYPGMIARAGGHVAGVLYFDVAPDDIDALDAFEGAEYQRDMVRVILDGGVQVDAAAYVYLVPKKLSESAWLPGAFQLERFIGAHCRDKPGEGPARKA